MRKAMLFYELFDRENKITEKRLEFLVAGFLQNICSLVVCDPSDNRKQQQQLWDGDGNSKGLGNVEMYLEGEPAGKLLNKQINKNTCSSNNNNNNKIIFSRTLVRKLWHMNADIYVASCQNNIAITSIVLVIHTLLIIPLVWSSLLKIVFMKPISSSWLELSKWLPNIF